MLGTTLAELLRNFGDALRGKRPFEGKFSHEGSRGLNRVLAATRPRQPLPQAQSGHAIVWAGVSTFPSQTNRNGATKNATVGGAHDSGQATENPGDLPAVGAGAFLGEGKREKKKSDDDQNA